MIGRRQRRRLSRGSAAVVLTALVACGGGGGKSASSSTSSSSKSTKSSASVSSKAASGYETALADLGETFDASRDAFVQATDVTSRSEHQDVLRDLRDAWFEFDSKVRDLKLPDDVQEKVNAVLEDNGALIADLDAMTQTIRSQEFNNGLVQLDKDVDSFLDTADALAEELGVEGTGGSGATGSSSSEAAGRAITDAKDARDRLLELAQKPGAVDPDAEPAIVTWPDEFPGVDFAGFGVLATPTKVSGFTIVTSKSKQVDFLAIAVIDTAGDCFGAVLQFDDQLTKVTKAIPVDDIDECIASNVSDSLGY